MLVLLAKNPGEAEWRLRGMAGAAAACAACTAVAFILCLAMDDPFGSRAFQVFVLASPALLLGVVVTGFSLRRFPPTGPA
jgi:hypothetical protein